MLELMPQGKRLTTLCHHAADVGIKVGQIAGDSKNYECRACLDTFDPSTPRLLLNPKRPLILRHLAPHGFWYAICVRDIWAVGSVLRACCHKNDIGVA